MQLTADDIWYFVDRTGTTKGPYNIHQLQQKSEEITANTYFWNGLSVPTWTKLKNLSNLYAKILGVNSLYIWTCDHIKDTYIARTYIKDDKTEMIWYGIFVLRWNNEYL